MRTKAATLKQLYEALSTEKNWVTIHQPASIESLLLNNRRAEEPSRVTLKLSLASSAYYQVHQEKDADFGPFDFLQFYARLYVPITADHLDRITQRLVEVNAKLPLIGFGLETENGVDRLHFRYMMLFPKGQMEITLVKRAAQLIFFLIEEYEPSFHLSN